MRLIKNGSFFLILLLMAVSVHAQPLIDTIYVNKKDQIAVKFPYNLKHYHFNPEKPPYEISSLSDDGLLIQAQAADAIPTHLYVDLKKKFKNLHFILVYKKNIDYNIDYNYTSDRLNDLINNREKKEETKTADPSTSYYMLLTKADKEYDQKQYEESKVDFEKAHDLKPDAPYPISKLADVKIKLVEKEKRDRSLQDSFKLYVANGEKKLKQNKLSAARNLFEQALVINPADTKIKGYIADIDDKENKQKQSDDLNGNYDAMIKSGDKAFKENDLETAEESYTKALSYKKLPYVQNKLAQIAKLKSDIAKKAAADELASSKKMAAAENAEKLRIAKEREKQDKYNTTITNADIEFGKSNLAKAKKLYLDAGNLKPEEAYPKQKLDEIKKAEDEILAKANAEKARLAAEAEAKRKYDIAMSKAKSYYLKEDLENALASYKQADSIKSDEPEPEKQIKIISDKLAEIARQNEINERYEIKRAIADSLTITKNYGQALAIFDEMHEIKPTETYPVSMKKYIQSEVKTTDAERIENERNEAKRLAIEKENKIQDMLIRGDSAKNAKDWELAIRNYLGVLNLDSLNSSARANLRICRNQFDLAKKQPEKPSTRAIEPVKATDANAPATEQKTDGALALQVNPIPYTEEELKSKYPDIDFKKLPPDQPDRDSSIDTKENQGMFYKVLTEKPRLDISDKNHKIKLICQGLHFIEGSASVYIKLLIQNNSDEDFLTGSMMLTWTRRSGSRIKLYPLYLYPAYLPIVKPGNEAAVIYVCKTYDISDDEKLQFIMNDRKNKIKLELNFKGSVYNEEFIR